MMSDEGNAAVAEIVANANKFLWDWHRVRAELELLSAQEQFCEATDTMVRECVFVNVRHLYAESLQAQLLGHDDWEYV